MIVKVTKVFDGYVEPTCAYEETDDPGIVIINGTRVALASQSCIEVTSSYLVKGRYESWYSPQLDPPVAVFDRVDIEIRRDSWGGSHVISVKRLNTQGDK